jgi:hypothetical protein
MRKGYTIAESWGHGSRRLDGPSHPSLAEFGKMSDIRKAVVSTDAKDALVYQSVEPGLRSRVFQARLNASRGVVTKEDSQLKDRIVAMQECGDLEPMVAAALLRLINDAPAPASGFTARDVPFEERGGQVGGESFYDPTRPAKAAGGDLDSVLRKMFAPRHDVATNAKRAVALAAAASEFMPTFKRHRAQR